MAADTKTKTNAPEPREIDLDLIDRWRDRIVEILGEGELSDADMESAARVLEFESQYPQPTNVIQAIAAVMRDLPGIGKTEQSNQGYQYRGIEAITAEIQQLLGKYCVVFTPRVERRDVREFPLGGKPWTEDTAEITYTVYGPGGVEDHIEVGPLIALGRDNSDKGMNKCMTQAFKYALLQTFCIGDRNDDADKDEAATPDAPAAELPPEQKVRSDLRTRIGELSAEHREAVRDFCKEHKIPTVTAKMDDEQLEAVTAKVDALVLAEQQDRDAEGSQDLATSHEGSPERSEQPGTGDDSPTPPESAEKRSDGPQTPSEADDDLDTLGRAHPQLLDEAIAEVARLDARGVDKALAKPFRMHSEGHIDQRRRRLTIAVLKAKVEAEQRDERYELIVEGHMKNESVDPAADA